MANLEQELDDLPCGVAQTQARQASVADQGRKLTEGGAPNDSSMRVLHFLPTRGIGGPERQVLGHLGAVNGPRFELSVYALNGGSEACLLAKRAAALGARTYWRPDRGPFDWASVGEVTKLIRSMGIRLLCAHGDKPHLLGLIAARRTGIPILAWVRGWTGETRRVRLYDRLDRRLLRYMDAVVAVSGSGREQVMRLGVPPDRAAVVHNAVDIATLRRETGRSARAELGLSAHDFLVVAVGRLSPEKAHIDLIAAARLMRDWGVCAHLLLIGDGAERPRLVAAVRAAGLSDRIHFMGHRREIGALLRDADVCALPSLTEGLPNAVLEAMAMGLPVVATAVGGVPELVLDGETGILVPAANSRSIANALAQLLRAEPEQRRRMGSAGYQRVKRHFSFEGQARKLEALYLSVVNRRSGLRAELI